MLATHFHEPANLPEIPALNNLKVHHAKVTILLKIRDKS